MTEEYWVKRLAMVDVNSPEFDSLFTLIIQDDYEKMDAYHMMNYAWWYREGFKDARKTEESARETIESTGGPSTEDQG